MNFRSFKNRWIFRFQLNYGKILYNLKFKNKFSKATNFLIFHQGRCGSTLLEKLLKTNNNIKTFSEIYSRSYIPMDSNIENMINYLSSTSNAKYNLYELKYGIENHLSFSLNRSLINLIKKNKVKVILLIRKNSIEQAKSTIYSHFLNDKFHFKKQDYPINKIVRVKSPFLLGGKFYMNIEEVANYIDKQTLLFKKYLDIHKVKYKIITYEEIINNRESFKNKVSEILNYSNLQISNKIETIKTPINYSKNLIID